ncbi:MAG TPA: class I SAM-dependent methyltransferase, partial [Actinoplanes sp.]|nr:class I SAM-dependent methyltransferase [Actinoplanes sp.]
DLGGGRSSRAPGPSDGDAPRPLNPGDGRSSRAPGPGDGEAPAFNPGDRPAPRAPGPGDRPASPALGVGRAPRVLDLGAGTGKLTRQLAARGLDVIAVDPSDGMLAELTRAVPGVPALRGTAEHVPLPDGSVDVVLMAQAWHWVDPESAVPEIARVLSPGGRLGVLWNIRDDRAAWIRRLEDIVGGTNHHRDARFGSAFGPVETREVRWSHRIGPDALLDLVASRSHVILLPPVERAALLAQVRQLSITHPDLVGRTEFEMPFITHCVRASLPS